jgi:hypothetical protein
LTVVCVPLSAVARDIGLENLNRAVSQLKYMFVVVGGKVLRTELGYRRLSRVDGSRSCLKDQGT